MPPKNSKKAVKEVVKSTKTREEIIASVKKAREVEHKGAGLDLKINALADELDDDTMLGVCQLPELVAIFDENDDEECDAPGDKADFKSFAKDWLEDTQKAVLKLMDEMN